MDIIVLMKRVPDLVEDLEVDDTGANSISTAPGNRMKGSRTTVSSPYGVRRYHHSQRARGSPAN